MTRPSFVLRMFVGPWSPRKRIFMEEVMGLGVLKPRVLVIGCTPSEHVHTCK